MSSSVEQIKARLGIVDVVGSYLKLEKAGVNFRARCPFHNEKTPSFFVSPTRETYHCFGCHKGGDLISFVQEIEGLEFIEALKVLADRAGIKLEKIDQGQSVEKDRLLAILDKAATFYSSVLIKNESALKYLKDRGLNDETIKSFRLGFAPADWQSLTPALIRSGFKNEDIEKAGLSIKVKETGVNRPTRFYDRFRGRIMFPIFDSNGKTVGFSGRIFGREDDKEAKYINTPATTIYDKSKVLYGLDRAKTAIRKEETCILVEGQMDLVLSHQAGFLNTVAVSGTALTERHIEAINRLAKKLVIAFDADSAGIAAGRKAVDLALSVGLEVRVVKISKGQDPADVIKESSATWSERVREAKHIIDFYLDLISEKYNETQDRASAIRTEVYPYIKALAHTIDRAYFISKVADLVGLSEEVVWQDFNTTKDRDSKGGVVQSSTTPKIMTKQEKIEEKLFSLLFWQKKLATPLIDAVALEKAIHEACGEEDYLAKIKFYLTRENELIMQAEILYNKSEVKQLKREVDELLKSLKLEFLDAELKKTFSLLKQAEKKGDEQNMDSLMKKCQNITHAINQLKI